jgi:hypothetical protein
MGVAVARLELARREQEFAELQQQAREHPSPELDERLLQALRLAQAAEETLRMEEASLMNRVPGQL